MSSQQPSPPAHRFWSAIESITGRAAVAEEWRRLMGDEFERCADLLPTSNDVSAGFPAVGRGLPYAVVRHGPDDFVAVPPDGGPTFSLTRADVLVRRLDVRKLSKLVAGAWGFDPAFEELPGYADAWRIGHHRPIHGDAIPAWLCVPLETADLRRFLSESAARHRGGYVVAIPTRRKLSQSIDEFLDATGGFPIVLQETVTIGRDGIWQVHPDARQRLLDYEERLRPDDQTLAERDRCVLKAMLVLGAVSSDRLTTTEKITTKAFGANGDPNSLKSVVAALGASGFVKTKKGAGGGCWLTAKGEARARRL